MQLRLHFILILLTLCFSKPLLAEQKYSIYLDADFNSAKTSSRSIQQGINTALAEVNYQIQGFSFDIIAKNHNKSPLESRDHLAAYINDKSALVVFSGLHSPPLISNQSYINNNGILLLAPWSAAASITRSTGVDNWIFRLSIDDSKAGAFLVNALVKKGYVKPHLLIEDTGWGRQNYERINQALNSKGIKAHGASWFNWDITLDKAKPIVNNITNSKPDLVLFIGNAAEATTLANAVITTQQKFTLPIYSHWGLTGGDLFKVISNQQELSLDLTFIQTKFAFTNSNLSPLAQQVLNNAITYNNDINTRQDIKAPVGFIHAYDLTKLLIAAINQAGLSGNRDKDKLAIKQALEHLKQPVEGLIKTYATPFNQYNKLKPDAHEALNASDYALGKYGSNGEIFIID